MPDKPPAPVEVTNPDPIAVEVVDQAKTAHADTAGMTEAKKTAAAAAVAADIARTDDQRRISGIWERTQQIIALTVVIPTVLTACFLSGVSAVNSDDTIRALGITAFTLLATLTGSVIGFYFGRTNHQRVGGVTTPTDESFGR